MNKVMLVILFSLCTQLWAEETGKEKLFKYEGNLITVRQGIESYQIPDFYSDARADINQAIPEATIFPKNGNYLVWTLTLTYSDGSPASGIPMSVSSQPYTLTGSGWRTPNGLANRFLGGSRTTVLQRYAAGVLRLQAPISPTSGQTDLQGEFSVRVDNFHTCGNESTPGSDLVTISYASQSSILKINCAVPGLVNIPDNPAGGLITSGLVGRHLDPLLLAAMQNLGRAWRDVPNKPSHTPDFLAITGATMRWGGINPPHLTHKFGGTIDLRPIGSKAGNVDHHDDEYDPIGTQAIVTALVNMGASLIIFSDNLVGVTKVRSDHSSHLHVSFLVNPKEPWFVPDGGADGYDFEGQTWINYEGLNALDYFIPTPNIGNISLDISYPE